MITCLANSLQYVFIILTEISVIILLNVKKLLQEMLNSYFISLVPGNCDFALITLLYKKNVN